MDAKHAYQPDQGAFQPRPPGQAGQRVADRRTGQRPGAVRGGLPADIPLGRTCTTSPNLAWTQHAGARRGSRRSSPIRSSCAEQTDPLASTVSALLGGPSDWLAPVGHLRGARRGAAGRQGPEHGVTLDDSQHLKVRLDHSGDRLRAAGCTELAAQLFATVQAQASAQLGSAEVDRWTVPPRCVLPRRRRPGVRHEEPGRRHLAAVLHQRGQPAPAARGHRRRHEGVSGGGPFGEGKAGLSSVAVRRNEQEAAGVRDDGRELVVGSLIDDQPFRQPGGEEHGDRPGGPAERTELGRPGRPVGGRPQPGGTRLMVLRNGTAPPVDVAVPELSRARGVAAGRLRRGAHRAGRAAGHGHAAPARQDRA